MLPLKASSFQNELDIHVFVFESSYFHLLTLQNGLHISLE